VILGEILFEIALNAVDGALFENLEGSSIWAVAHSVMARKILMARIYRS
jgi:hypothetical protein